MSDLLSRLNQFGPRLCRAMARTEDGRKAITHRELALRAGLSKDRIIRLSELDKWDSVPLGEAERYALGCGLRLHRLRSDFYERMRRAKSLMSGLNAKQRKLYGRLLPKLPD